VNNALKETEYKLISELMKNSRRSDRELAKAVGVSQPTVSRTIKKLEDEGYIQEYTMIPNFQKLGFQIMSIIFTKMKEEIGPDFIEEVRSKVRENEKRNPSPALMAMSGMGFDSDRVLVLLCEDYSTYSRYISMLREYPLIDIEDIRSFMIDLSDKSQFRSLTLSWIAAYLDKKQKEKK